jgi:hypothetical protein
VGVGVGAGAGAGAGVGVGVGVGAGAGVGVGVGAGVGVDVGAGGIAEIHRRSGRPGQGTSGAKVPRVRRTRRCWLAFVVAAIELVACRGKGETHAAPSAASADPPAPSFRFTEGRLVLEPARVSVDVPAPWAPWTIDDPRIDRQLSPGSMVAFQRPDGSMLMVLASRHSPGTGIEPTLRGILEDKRKQYGTVDDVVWAADRVGGFSVRTLAFSVAVESLPVRFKMWMLGNEAYWVNFICTALATDFTGPEADCRSVVDTLHVLLADAAP